MSEIIEKVRKSRRIAPNREPGTVTTSEAAVLLGVDRRTIHSWRKSKRLLPVNQPSAGAQRQPVWLYRRSDVLALLHGEPAAE